MRQATTKLPLSQATGLRFIKHAVVNMSLPPVLMVMLTKINKNIPRSIETFLGRETMKFLPLINIFGVSSVITLIETAIRYGCGKLDRVSGRVEFPGLSMSQKTALLYIATSCALQTTNSVLTEYASGSPGQVLFSNTYSDIALALGSQILITNGIERLIGSFSNDDGYARAAGRTMCGGFASLFSSQPDHKDGTGDALTNGYQPHYSA